MISINYLFIVILIVLNVNSIKGQYANGEYCPHLSTGKEGICVLLKYCPEVKINLKENIFPQRCGFEGLEPIVCCLGPQILPSRLPGEISNTKCLEYSKYVTTVEMNSTPLFGGSDIQGNECPFNRQNLVVERSPSSRKEFPHMVQLGYDGSDGKVWTCGGSLISEEFVLTAAQCLSDRYVGDAKYARMGIVDLDDDNHRQQFNIIQIVKHPKYKPPSLYHDIGLAKLHKEAELNSWVRPACLYTKNESPGSKVIASGWGKTHFVGPPNTILMSIILELYNEASCNKTYKREAGTSRLQEGIRDDILICAGPSKDPQATCQGDFGGPLQIYRTGDKQTSCMYDVIGVISFGKACGTAVNIPLVFTRVSYYVPWIENIVWPV